MTRFLRFNALRRSGGPTEVGRIAGRDDDPGDQWDMLSEGSSASWDNCHVFRDQKVPKWCDTISESTADTMTVTSTLRSSASAYEAASPPLVTPATLEWWNEWESSNLHLYNDFMLEPWRPQSEHDSDEEPNHSEEGAGGQHLAVTRSTKERTSLPKTRTKNIVSL
mmetsp:Transcript_93883/g.265636  ORF Transcript_93883/g.265636 Transcript_93883/m.265636 type:complete len:166 (-) Transcript_93883:50-547(-)